MAAARPDLASGYRRGQLGAAARHTARLPGRGRVMSKIGYARVSTRSQNDDSQAALQAGAPSRPPRPRRRVPSADCEPLF